MSNRKPHQQQQQHQQCPRRRPSSASSASSYSPSDSESDSASDRSASVLLPTTVDSARIARLLSVAIAEAETSCSLGGDDTKFYHGCVIFAGGKILGTGHNHGRTRVNGSTSTSTHAEVSRRPLPTPTSPIPLFCAARGALRISSSGFLVREAAISPGCFDVLVRDLATDWLRKPGLSSLPLSLGGSLESECLPLRTLAYALLSPFSLPCLLAVSRRTPCGGFNRATNDVFHHYHHNHNHGYYVKKANRRLRGSDLMVVRVSYGKSV
jgi:hypothetical protein